MILVDESLYPSNSLMLLGEVNNGWLVFEKIRNTNTIHVASVGFMLKT